MGGSAGLAGEVTTSPGGYWPTSTRWKKALALEYLSDFFCGYYLGVYLSACKRISLDDHYFMWIFTIENWNLAVFDG